MWLVLKLCFFLPQIIDARRSVGKIIAVLGLHGRKYEAVDAKEVTAVSIFLFQIGNPVGCFGV